MNLTQVVARAGEIAAELEELRSLEVLDEEQDARYVELETEGLRLADVRAELEQRAANAARIAAATRAVEDGDGVRAGAPRFNRDLGSPLEIDVDRAGRSELRGAAAKAVEQVGRYEMDDASKERVTEFVERYDGRDAAIAKRVILTGSDEYKSAFTKVITGNGFALSAKEQDAISRAMSLTDGAGGFAVPFPIDPTLINLGNGSVSPFRQISRVVPNHPTDTWQGLATTQMSASFDAEAAEVSDDTTTFTQPSITVRTARAFVPASIEIAQDYPNLVGDLVELFADAKMTLEDTVFATGAAGSNQPVGIVTALTGGASVVASATTDTFALADVYALAEALPPRYRGPGARAAFASNLNIYHDIRQFGAAGSPAPFVTEANADTVLGRPWFEASAMDGTINALADNLIMVYGDWRNYVIVDRVGFNVEYIPHLFATGNNRPSGQRGWFASWRVGADSVNDNAFRMLNVT